MPQIIQPTPILKGKDAKKFRELTENVKYDPEKEKFLNHCKELVEKFHGKKIQLDKKQTEQLKKGEILIYKNKIINIKENKKIKEILETKNYIEIN